MKNIYLLQTDKPSRLWTNNLRRRLELDEFPSQHPSNIAKHLYITSDEVIKEGDYVFNLTSRYVYPITELWEIVSYERKIILTTDQELIDDGVQAIDEDFLNWFVKNPSCEYVPIISPLFGHPYIIWIEGLNFIEEPLKQAAKEYSDESVEEPKKHLIDIMKGDEELGLYELGQEVCNYCGKTLREQMKGCKEITCYRQYLRKQETTIEKTAKELYPINNTGSMFMATRDELNNSYKQKAFIEGAKWQKEQDKRLYSEEEVLELLNDCRGENPIDVSKWFEQNKK